MTVIDKRHSKLFTPLRIGDITLKHRVIMAPLTRTRCFEHIPTDMVVEYYSQRATDGGLLISEGTHTSVMVCYILFHFLAIDYSGIKCFDLGRKFCGRAWNLHPRAETCLEKGDRWSSRKGWIHLLPALECKISGNSSAAPHVVCLYTDNKNFRLEGQLIPRIWVEDNLFLHPQPFLRVVRPISLGNGADAPRSFRKR